jgi:hypothetical protein
MASDPFHPIRMYGPPPELCAGAEGGYRLLNYRDNPQYDYYNNDIFGRIDIKDEETFKELEQPDQVFLKSFGYSYNSKHYRAVISTVAN